MMFLLLLWIHFAAIDDVAIDDVPAVAVVAVVLMFLLL